MGYAFTQRPLMLCKVNKKIKLNLGKTDTEIVQQDVDIQQYIKGAASNINLLNKRP